MGPVFHASKVCRFARSCTMCQKSEWSTDLAANHVAVYGWVVTARTKLRLGRVEELSGNMQKWTRLSAV